MPKRAKSAKPSKKTQVFGANGISYTFPQGNGGPIQIKIDFAQVPEPASFYYADSLLLTDDPDLHMVVLSFGRRDPSSNELGDRIDVVMPARALAPFLASTPEVEKTVGLVVASFGKAGQVRPISLPKTFAAAPTLFANAIFIAVGEGESSLDFYHLSPRQTHFAKTQKMPMQIQPAVRVILSSVLTKYFFDILKPFTESENPQSMIEGAKRAVIGRT